MLSLRESSLCLAPLILLSVLFMVSWGSADYLLNRDFLSLPVVWWMVLVMVFLSGGVFLAHFEDTPRATVTWSSIVLSGALVILIFAALHRDQGVLCTAPVCAKAVGVAPDRPYVLAPLGGALPHGPGGASGEDLKVDHGVTTALYFSVVTFTTLGYGDFQPMPRMRLLAASEAVFGYLFLGMFVGALIDLGGKLRGKAAKPVADPQPIAPKDFKYAATPALVRSPLRGQSTKNDGQGPDGTDGDKE